MIDDGWYIRQWVMMLQEWFKTLFLIIRRMTDCSVYSEVLNCTWNWRLTSTSCRSSGDLAAGSIRHEQKDLNERSRGWRLHSDQKWFHSAISAPVTSEKFQHHPPVKTECLTSGVSTRGWASAPPSESPWAESGPRWRSYEGPEAQRRRRVTSRAAPEPG